MFEAQDPPPPTADDAPYDGEDGVLDTGLEPAIDQALETAACAVWNELEAAEQAVDRLDADATLTEVDAARRAVNLAEVRQLELAAHWADLHADAARSGPGPARERLAMLGGDGTPTVLEFAAAELALVLRMTDHAAAALMADALDLRHRFPLLWDRLRTGTLPVWSARKTAQLTRRLSQQAAVEVDRQVAQHHGQLSWARLRKVLDAAILRAEPREALSAAEQAAADAGVSLGEEVEHGYGTMFIKAAAGDLRAFDEALDLVARALKILGDTRAPEQRRASAVGILANPRQAQRLVNRAESTRQAQIEAAAARRAGDHEAADAADARIDRRPVVFGKAVMYYHLTGETMDAILRGASGGGATGGGAQVTRVEDVGPVIAEQVKRWLGHANVTVKPVIDLPGLAPVDRYEVPPHLAEAVGLIHPADTFPYATSTSRDQDQDHTIPYRSMASGGPPGQTDARRLARLTRRHHRIKTLAGWTVTQVRVGGWLWRSPHGWYSLVDQHGTTALGTL